jgi:hypothetical protein
MVEITQEAQEVEDENVTDPSVFTNQSDVLLDEIAFAYSVKNPQD